MNTVREWYTVEPDKKYTVKNDTAGSSSQHTGKELHEGLKVDVKGGKELRLEVTAG